VRHVRNVGYLRCSSLPMQSLSFENQTPTITLVIYRVQLVHSCQRFPCFSWTSRINSSRACAGVAPVVWLGLFFRGEALFAALFTSSESLEIHLYG
jgi:hypothetical protein